jgi:hypothetical protein
MSSGTYEWTVFCTVPTEARQYTTDTRGATIEDALSAAREEIPESHVITGLTRGVPVTVATKPGIDLPRIFVWADKTKDHITPGFVVHAVAEDGTTLWQEVHKGDQIEWVKRSVDPGTKADAAFSDAYPLGYTVVWVDEPSWNLNLTAARMASERRYEFTELRPGTYRMTSKMGKGRVIGFIVHRPELKAVYALRSTVAPQPDSLLPDPPYPDLARAAQGLHAESTSGT